MQKLTLFICVWMLSAGVAMTQTKMLTAEDASGMNPKIIPASLSQLQWKPGTQQFIYVAGNSLVQGTPANRQQDTLVRLADLNQLLRFYKLDTLKSFPQITMLSENEFRYVNRNKLYLCNILNNSVEMVNNWDEKAENKDFGTVTHQVAYTKDNNLYISVNGKETAVTSEKNPGIICGSGRVHRNEFGIGKGTFWSPGEHMLAFYRMDETMVADYPLVDISPRIAAVKPVKYPMAGMTSHQVTVGVYDLNSGKTIYLETASAPGTEPALQVEYLTNITWSPDEKYLYVATLNRDQNFMQLNKYSASDGKFVKTLFTEKSDAYVEPLQGLRFLPGNPDQFLWESRRDGYNHFYHYNAGGELLRQITSGDWEVTDFLSFSKKGDRIFFLCNKDNPIDRRIYMAELKSGQVLPVSLAPGTHAGKVSEDGKYLIDSYSSANIARQIEIIEVKGNPVQVLLENSNPLKDYKLGETQVFVLKNEAGTDLFCRLIKPVDFDPSKRYPVVIYVYGGPHSQLVTNSWLSGGGLFLNHLASQGYVVFTLDNRGTSGRGRDFEQVIFRHLGNKEVRDQMTGVEYLRKLPYVDTTRIGINGWSYGGFMTISMMLKQPGVFKAAVCGGPVIDWKYYEVMYGERYMDTPETNPAGYEEASLLNYVRNLQGRLLIIHDDMDDTVLPQNSMSFLKKCVDEGKQVDFFMYPGHEHNVRGKDRVHLNQKIVQYFQDHL